MESDFPRAREGSLKERSLRTILSTVRLQGHTYVELRKEGKKLIFFCTVCLAPCYNDSCLSAHLKGNPHSERLAALKVILFKPNPWPFNDGVFFFHGDPEEKSESLPSSEKVLDIHHADADSLVIYKSSAAPTASTQSEDNADSITGEDGTGRQLVIPDVLQKDEISNLAVRKFGVGKIGGRFSEKDGVSSGIRKIWCEWLGNANSINEDIDEYEFAIVTFSYNYNLGRRGLLFGSRYMLPPCPHSDAGDSSSSRVKKRKLYSDTVNATEALANQGEESQSSSNSKSKVVFDDQLIYPHILSSKTMRKKWRKQQLVASERSCDLCKQKMLPNKDVATLLNRVTGKLACSSRNLTGAFHVFHISCLIQWILLCEVEIFSKQPVEPKEKQKPGRKVKGKNRRKHKMQDNQICSTFCPECQGTGIRIDGHELESPTVSLSQIFRHKIKLCNARKAWIKSPESLENCSLGFNFPFQSDEMCQENVAPLKLLHFYRADDQI